MTTTVYLKLNPIVGGQGSKAINCIGCIQNEKPPTSHSFFKNKLRDYYNKVYLFISPYPSFLRYLTIPHVPSNYMEELFDMAGDGDKI